MTSVQRWRPSRITSSALALSGSTGFTAILGFLFWGIATHLYSAADLGRAAAAVSAMSLIAALAQLNLPRFYPRFLPQAGPRARRFILLGYAGCSAASIAAGVIYVASGLGNTIFAHSHWMEVTFILAVPLWVIFNIEDSVLTGLRAAVWVPIENVAFGLAKLLLIVLLIGNGVLGVFLGWTLPVILVIGIVNYFIFTRLLPAHEKESHGISILPDRSTLWKFIATGSFAAQSTIISRSLIPLIVVARLGATAGAYFYVPWLVASILPIMLWSVSTSFVVESGFEPGSVLPLMRRTIRIAVLISIPTVLGLLTLGPAMMHLLANRYASNGTGLLRLVAVASLTNIVFVVYETLVWLEGTRIWRLAVVEVGYNILLISGTLVLMSRFRLDAAGFALVIAGGVVSGVVLAPTVRGLRALRTGRAM